MSRMIDGNVCKICNKENPYSNVYNVGIKEDGMINKISPICPYCLERLIEKKKEIYCTSCNQLAIIEKPMRLKEYGSCIEFAVVCQHCKQYMNSHNQITLDELKGKTVYTIEEAQLNAIRKICYEDKKMRQEVKEVL